MSNRVNLVAPASPIECLPYLPNVPAIQYKLGPVSLTLLGNSNVLRLPLRKRDSKDDLFQCNSLNAEFKFEVIKRCTKYFEPRGTYIDKTFINTFKMGERNKMINKSIVY